ncbi:hypothetical protein SAMN06265784_108126 [Paraburkholderia susongensis]|uniref:Uncharacterized protein n=1 Tax=Paraburkholderia susongensis TaxID=1515439 RepID=A0A1X7LSI3_9BURK|nr:hypothetical protein SAMN06265784_108126 [Paraburkholderia susongensis]
MCRTFVLRAFLRYLRYQVFALSPLSLPCPRSTPAMSTSPGPLKVLIILVLALVLPCAAIAVLIGVFGLLVKLFGHG